MKGTSQYRSNSLRGRKRKTLLKTLDNRFYCLNEFEQQPLFISFERFFKSQMVLNI